VRAIALIQDFAAELRDKALVGQGRMFEGMSSYRFLDADFSLFLRTILGSEGATANGTNYGCGNQE